MFVPNKANKNGRPVMWMPKPRTPAQVKAGSTDQAAYKLAKHTPTSQRQEILGSGK